MKLILLGLVFGAGVAGGCASDGGVKEGGTGPVASISQTRDGLKALADCLKTPEPSDQELRVIEWEFHLAYVGGPFPNGHFINYFTFRYSPSDPTDPCKIDSEGGQVCLHDVSSGSIEGMPTCKFLGQDQQVTQIKVRSGSVRRSGASMNDCTCP